MRITILAFSLILVSTTAAHARDIAARAVQISGGSNFASSSIELDGGSSLGESDTDITEFDVALAYYFSQNVGVGFTFISRSEDDGDIEITSDALGPTVVFNIPVQENLSLQLGGTYLLTFDQEIDIEGLGTVEADGDGFEVGAQLLLFLTDSAAMNFGFSILEASSEIQDTDLEFDTSGTSLGVGLTVIID
jgi:hypothetical protein